jgi:hypothetical protein
MALINIILPDDIRQTYGSRVESTYDTYLKNQDSLKIKITIMVRSERYADQQLH